MKFLLFIFSSFIGKFFILLERCNFLIKFFDKKLHA